MQSSADQVTRESFNSLRGQRYRCSNSNATDYKYYGAKGIKVIYDSKDFYKWFKKERKKIPLDIKVNVDRLDHEKDYCFGNIQLISKSKNVIESNVRRGKLTAKGILKLKEKGLTQKEIATRFNVKQASISLFFKHSNLKWGNRVSRKRGKYNATN